MATILFDVDFTLFNTPKLKNLIDASLLKILKVPEDEYFLVGPAYVSYIGDINKFRPSEYTELLFRTFGVKKEKLDAEFDNILHYKKCVYPDVLPVLKKLKKSGHELGIYSEGGLRFQLKKIMALEVSEFINPDLVFVSEDKARKAFLKGLPDGSWIIDDNITKLQIIADLKEKNFSPIWIKRDKSEKDKSIKTIHQLSELVDIIDNVTA